jgi:hypothetical protein
MVMSSSVAVFVKNAAASGQAKPETPTHAHVEKSA